MFLCLVKNIVTWCHEFKITIVIFETNPRLFIKIQKTINRGGISASIIGLFFNLSDLRSRWSRTKYSTKVSIYHAFNYSSVFQLFFPPIKRKIFNRRAGASFD